MTDNPTQGGFRTYIGLRYVPVIVGLWDITKNYEQLSIVTYEGNSYTSKKPVPAGITLDNEEYWVMTGNYNVQVANLQNEVEVAVRQILDYATDFEKFKTDMVKLYEDFTVDADGQVLAKVEEYERLIGEQYEAFVRYVNQALADYRTEMDSFTAETNQRITDYLENTTERLDTQFSNLSDSLITRESNFEANIRGDVRSLQNAVSGLQNSGSMSSDWATNQVSGALGGYSSLDGRLDDMRNIYLGYYPIAIQSGQVFDMNNYTNIGIYSAYKSGGSSYDIALLNTPFVGEITDEGFTLIVYRDKSFNSFVKQVLTINHNDTISTYERYQYNGVFQDWKETVKPNNVMLVSYLPQCFANFNTLPDNICWTVAGYSSENVPANAPDIITGDGFTVVVYGVTANRTQLVYTGTNNRCFIRRNINGTWTEWDYLTTKDDLDSLSATISADFNSKLYNANILNNMEEIETVSELDDLSTNKVFNVANLGGGILPDDSIGGVCYIYNVSSGNNVYQIIVNGRTGVSYYRAKHATVWTSFEKSYDTSTYREYNDWGSSGVSLATLNSTIINNTKLFTSKIVEVKFNEDINSDSILSSEDRIGYLLTKEYGTAPNNFIQQTFITITGRIFTRKYTGASSSWLPFNETEYGSDYVIYGNYVSGISLTDFNGLIFNDNKIGVVHFNEDITGDINPNSKDRYCYVYSRGVYQTFVTFTGRTFNRKFDSVREIWGDFDESYVSSYIRYGDFLQGISLNDFNALTMNTKQVGKVHFNEDITGDTTPNAIDRLCYVYNSYYGNDLYQVIITFSGRVFTRQHMYAGNYWTSFTTPYYTKAEIDAMLQNI